MTKTEYAILGDKIRETWYKQIKRYCLDKTVDKYSSEKVDLFEQMIDNLDRMDSPPKKYLIRKGDVVIQTDTVIIQ